MSFATTNGLKNAPEAISEGQKLKNFPGGGGGGGMPPDPPLEGVLLYSPLVSLRFAIHLSVHLVTAFYYLQ